MSTAFEGFKVGLLCDQPSAALRLTPASADDVVALGELIREPKLARGLALPPAQVTEEGTRPGHSGSVRRAAPTLPPSPTGS